MAFRTRPFQPDDAYAVDNLWHGAFAGFEEDFPGCEDALALGAARLAATGSTILVAQDDADSRCVGVIRTWQEEGVGWFDLLVAIRPFAGRQLVREVERRSQARGLRLLRVTIPSDPALEAYFSSLGFREVAAGPGGHRTLERRLPLLTVREQRPGDADAIAALTGLDPWPFQQGARPGWFVLADGERAGGVIAVRQAAFGEAEVHVLALDTAYRGRGLEPWMLSRAATWAETNGFHTVRVAGEHVAAVSDRDLEDAGWFEARGVFTWRPHDPDRTS
jgi:GNAT superfamily N-acetyltransferase